MSEIHRFSIEHNHGFLRGTCNGILLVNFYDVEYKPVSGDHGFRMPFKALILKIDGQTANLFFASDNKRFQTLKLQNTQEAQKLNQVWNGLKPSPDNNQGWRSERIAYSLHSQQEF